MKKTADIASLLQRSDFSIQTSHPLARAAPRPAVARRQMWWSVQARVAPYLFVLPFALVFAIFMAYPLAASLSMSFQKTVGNKPVAFVGFANYRFLLGDKLFWLACANTLLFAILFLPLELIGSLGLAMLLNSSRVRWRGLFRFAFFSTFLIGQVFLAALSLLIFAPRYGLLNRAIGALLPRVGAELNWRGNPNLAMAAIVLASLWVSLGYAMIYWLAALQSVDRELYESAQIDGAGRLGRFWHVTLPGIRPMMVFLLLVGTIASLQLFELPYVFFQGPGPRLAGLTIVMYLYEQGIGAGDLGFAAAVGWVLLVLILGITLVQLRAGRAMNLH